MSGLSIADQGIFYFGSIIGMPRNLLECLVPNLPGLVFNDKSGWHALDSYADMVNQLEVLDWQKRFAFDRMANGKSLEPFSPPVSTPSPDALVYSAATRTNFVYSTDVIPEWQAHFGKLFAALAHQYGVKTAMIYVPIMPEARNSAIPERAFWPDIFGNDMTLVGIPPAKLFSTISSSDLPKLYGEPIHFNKNGQEYFTRLMTPALLKIYESSTNN